MRLRDRRPEQQSNLANFLETQTDSLESLSVDGWIENGHRSLMELYLFQKFSAMPILKKICVKNFLFNYTTIPDYIIQQNNSVTHLILKAYMLEENAFTLCLKTFPNIERLEIWSFSNEIADIISEQCKFLKHLVVYKYCIFLTQFSNEEFFINLKSFTIFHSKLNISQNFTNGRSKKLLEKMNVQFKEA